jgi:hypothetical protein
MRATRTELRWVFIAGVILSAIVAAQAFAQGPCLSVNLGRPVVFPDGSEHLAGQLTLCDWKAYTPVTQIHRSYMDGRPIQMLMGTRSTTERSAEEPDEVIFRSNGDGRLELLGYSRTIRGRSMTVSFKNKDSRKVNHRLARANKKDDDLLVVLMARPH